MLLKLSLAAALAAAVLAPTALAAGQCGDHPWCDTSLSADARADLLLAALTDDEKIGLLAGDDYGGVVTAGEDDYTGTSDGVPRVDLPTVHYGDGPVGVREGTSTAMPIPMALAASFDPRLARLHGRTIATEAKLKGNDVVYAPTVNILRTPLWGRAFESYGEDPFLSGTIATGWIRGAESTGVIANVKHYAANNQEGAGADADSVKPGDPPHPSTEGSRFLVNVNVEERALREIYLPAFEMSVKQGHVGTIMCSYPKINGTYACENSFLLKDVLDGWGFNGYVLADYGAAHEAGASLPNGLDFDPWGAVGHAYEPPQIMAALASGRGSMADVDEHVKQILRTHFAYGVFDRDAYTKQPDKIDRKAHLTVARRIAEAGITLLKNHDGTLPLRPSKLKTLAVIGKPADQFTTGGGSADVHPFDYVSARDAIKERAGRRVKVTYDDGSDPERAAQLAAHSDRAIVFGADYMTEFIDRRCLSLECPNWNGDQDALIDAVTAANERTTVVLMTGAPVLTPWRKQAAAIVEAWYAGNDGGRAIARVLFGDVDPGGRLPATFPRSEEQYPYAGDPEAYPGVNQEVHYKEGVLVGYRWFDAKGLRPAYPFGFGLSYTRFRYGPLSVRRRGPDSATVSFTVRNVGRRRGIEVPQLYLGLPSPAKKIEQPPLQLKDFRKLTLRPGRRARVSFRIDPRDISYWDTEASDWRVAPGCYTLMVGRSSRRVARIAEESFGGGRCG